jgi:hypothetical protein
MPKGVMKKGFQFTLLINKRQKDEKESIEKTYDSRRVPKAAGRGGARYLVLYSLVTVSCRKVGTGK